MWAFSLKDCLHSCPMNKYWVVSLLLLLITNYSNAQRNDSCHQSPSQTRVFVVHGCLQDEKGNPIVNANVLVYQDGNPEPARDLTDFDGLYRIKIQGYVNSTCNVKYSYLGRNNVIENVPLATDSIVVNGRIQVERETWKGTRCYYTCCRITCDPLIDPEYPGGHASHSSYMLPKGW